MSLVSTWVEATDGMFYQNPVICGDGWYVCFDDDDPPELVVKKSVKRTPLEILRDAGIPWKSVRPRGFGGKRMFNGKFKEAKACFFELSGPIPIPQAFYSRHENPQGQGVYYAFTKGNNR